ncbi:MAG: hypothetical protein ABIJ22_01940 [Patescibacteria group bacterium]
MTTMSGLWYNYDTMIKQLISLQNFTSVQEVQSGISKLFKKAKKNSQFYTVLRNQEPLGVLIPQKLWEDFIEDIEAMQSPNYLQQIAKSRAQKTLISSEEIEKELSDDI